MPLVQCDSCEKDMLIDEVEGEEYVRLAGDEVICQTCYPAYVPPKLTEVIAKRTKRFFGWF